MPDTTAATPTAAATEKQQALPQVVMEEAAGYPLPALLHEPRTGRRSLLVRRGHEEEDRAALEQQ